MHRIGDPREPNALLDSAIDNMKASDNTFIVKPWREIMTQGLAQERQTALKTAAKAAAQKGIEPFKHNPAPERRRGLDTQTVAAVKSGLDSFIKEVETMATNKPTPAAKTAPAKTAPAKTAPAKTAPVAAAAPVKTEAGPTAKELRAREVAVRKAERESRALENKAARESRAAALLAEGKTYTGSMTTLADRVKTGAYVKGLNGQLRTTDALAEALDAVPPENVVKLALKALNFHALPEGYENLNMGQQSMNLRNRMRGAINRGELTIEKVKAIRDAEGYATAESDAQAKKDARDAAQAKKKQDKELADKAALAAAEKAKVAASTATPVPAAKKVVAGKTAKA